MIIGQYVLYAVNSGNNGANNISGQYRLALVIDTSTGLIGTPGATYTLRVLGLPADNITTTGNSHGVGSTPDITVTGVTRDLPITTGTRPTGNPGTCIEIAVAAQFYTSS